MTVLGETLFLVTFIPLKNQTRIVQNTELASHAAIIVHHISKKKRKKKILNLRFQDKKNIKHLKRSRDKVDATLCGQHDQHILRLTPRLTDKDQPKLNEHHGRYATLGGTGTRARQTLTNKCARTQACERLDRRLTD